MNRHYDETLLEYFKDKWFYIILGYVVVPRCFGF